MLEKQLTFAAKNHQLTNINDWTADSQWLVYDVRPSGASFTGLTIERVNVRNGRTEVLYTAGDGAHVGVVTVSPDLPPRYVFIHGPEHPDENWHYDFHHRRGVILTGGKARNMDACDITAPYTPGALRGGSHVHVFSPDGSRLSYTYNDHVMHEWDSREDLRATRCLRRQRCGKRQWRDQSGDREKTRQIHSESLFVTLPIWQEWDRNTTDRQVASR